MDTQRGQDPFNRFTDAYRYTHRQTRLRQPALHRSRNLYRDPLQPVSRVRPKRHMASSSLRARHWVMVSLGISI